MRKPAWLSYMKKILWRYPDNHPRENDAIEKACTGRVPDLVTLAYIEKRMDYKSAIRELHLTEKDAKKITDRFLIKIGDNLNLPREGRE